MQLAEVGKLLAIIKSFDNRKLDESTAMAWKVMLDKHVPQASLADAEGVVFDWFGVENPYFEVRHLLDGLRRKLRLTPKQIADDVRSAKARGLVDTGWPRDKALPAVVREKLAAARATDRENAPAEIEAGESPLQLEVGRRP